MARVIVATVRCEGGFYSPTKDATAPIRFYSDRWCEDDIAARFTGKIKRNRLTKNEFRRVRRAARDNAKAGRV